MTDQLDLLGKHEPDFRGVTPTRMGGAHPPYRRGSDTSRRAAESMIQAAATLEVAVMDALRIYGPMTSDEIADAIWATVLAVRPRITELKALGWLEDTGDRRANASGRMAAVVKTRRAR